MTGLLIVLGLLAVLVVAVIASYNRFVRQRNIIEESWKQVDVELRRRYDLIPNLVETVKGYAAHERGVLEAVINARAKATAPSGSIAEQAVDEAALTASLRGLLAVAEAYPDLKADSQFSMLQSQLGETEDRIAAGRRFYNSNVRAYNTRIETFPSSIVASTFSFEKADYFEENDEAVRAAVKVDFGAGPVSPTPPAPSV
ncbi:MAG TPA: LemA family protein [Mycobacteriales bacterium]|nr:LemA family protein [Mycobacteriales bacterium]